MISEIMDKQRECEFRPAGGLPNLVIDGFGGPGRDRTDDLFHAMEARSQTAPQAHMLQGCNFSILSAGVGFVNAARQRKRAWTPVL